MGQFSRESDSVKLICANRLRGTEFGPCWIKRPMNKVISMTGYRPGSGARITGVRDRRYTIRYPFAADAEMIDMESGQQLTGVTSDISLGGCFICTSKMFRVNTRARLRLTRRGEAVDAFVVVRIVKPRVGLGVEFFDLEAPNNDILGNWIASLRRHR
jgi:hypothetical protein